MASCDRGDTQFPELSGGGSGSGSRARSGLLAVAAASPISQPFLAGAPAPAQRCRPGGTRGGKRRGRFQRRKWLLDARERLICNWGRADWCSWRRRGGRSGGGGGGGGGWPLSNGEGGGGDAVAEGAGLGCATRRCHHCTGANSGGGAGSYFPLLPRCCFCRLGKRRRRRGRRGRQGGRGRRRAKPRPCAHPGGRREPCEAFSGAGRWPGSSPPRDFPLSCFLPHSPPRTPPSLTGSATQDSAPRLSPRFSPTPTPPPTHRPRASRPWAPPPGRAGAAAARRPVNAASKQKSGRFKRAFETR